MINLRNREMGYQIWYEVWLYSRKKIDHEKMKSKCGSSIGIEKSSIRKNPQEHVSSIFKHTNVKITLEGQRYLLVVICIATYN